jgi:phage shock protein PspC (stress-responsive transcriptional regulator)
MNTTTTQPDGNHTDSGHTSDHTDSNHTGGDQTDSGHTGHGYGPDFGLRGQAIYRPRNDRMLAGVASGLGRYLGVDPAVIRIILVVLLVVGGAGVPLYAAGWLLIPEEGCDQSLAGQFIESLQSRSR